MTFKYIFPLTILLVIGIKAEAQNVGIGTTTPVNKLSVNGKVNITDSLGIGTNTPAGELHVKSTVISNSTIDQQQTIIDGSAGSTVNWQSFTAGATGLLTRVDLRVSSPLFGSSSPGTIKIFMGEGNTGTVLSTTDVTFQDVNNTFQSFALSSFPAVIAGNKYTIEFNVPDLNVTWVDVSTNNAYAGGRASRDIGWDYLFKTYVASQVADGLVVADGKAKVANLQITNGAYNGYVLHSDASGNASWVSASTLETDPKVGTLTNNKIPKWNGTTLANGLIFDNGTNVGIGTITPAQKLDVAGTIKTTNLQITNGATNGFVLKSDASGIASWVNANTLSVTETDPKVGTLSINTIPKWNGTTLANGLIFDNGTNVGIGTTTPAGELHVKSAEISHSIIDQIQTTYSGISECTVGWQSFTAGTTGFLTRVDLGVSSPINGNSSPGTIKIFMGEGNTGTVLSTTAVTFQDVFNFNPFQSFILSSFPAVIAGNKYTIEFSVPAYSTRQWVRVTSTGYAGGMASFSNLLDCVFKTYVAGVVDGLVVTDGKAKVTNLQITNGANNGFVLQSDASGNASWVNANTTITELDPKVGTLTSNKIPKWNGTTLADGLVFDNGTNVGIGTITPANKLSINGNADISGNLGIGTITPANKLSINGNADISGNLGIGTSTAIEKLDINGRLRVANGIIQNGSTAITTSSDLGLYSQLAGQYIRLVTNGGSISFFTENGSGGVGSTPKMELNALGQLGIGTVSPANKLSVNGNADVSGNLGIGITSPATTLDVNGGIRTKYSSTTVISVTAGTNSYAVTIPALPAGWDYTNTVVILSASDGTAGNVQRVKLTSLTNIDVQYQALASGAVRFNWIIFKM